MAPEPGGPAARAVVAMGQTVAVSDGESVVDATIEYALDDWAVESRQMLRQLLVGAEVPHVWEGGRLVVPEPFESVTDDLVDEVASTFAGTLDDPDVPRVAFDVADFDPELVDELVAALDAAGVGWLLDAAGDLVVAESDADVVDAEVERLEFPHALPVTEPADAGSGASGTEAGEPGGADAGDGEGVAAEGDLPEIDPDRVLGGLFVAADRLARSATDPAGVLDTVSLAAELAAGAPPFGFDTTVWGRITADVTALASLLEDADADDAAIESAAAGVRDLLRHWV